MIMNTLCMNFSQIYIYYLHLCVVNFACTYGCRVTLVKSLMPISSIQSNYATMQIMQTTNGITVNNFFILKQIYHLIPT